jgi:hypothetical protein
MTAEERLKIRSRQWRARRAYSKLDSLRNAVVRRQLLKRETNVPFYFVIDSAEFEKWREKTEPASMKEDLCRL